jgi:hypothetical protein
MRALAMTLLLLCLSTTSFADLKEVGSFKVQRVHSVFEAGRMINAKVVWDTRASLANIVFKDRLGLIDVSLTDAQRKALLACLDSYFKTDKVWKERLTENTLELGKIDSVITYMPYADAAVCSKADDQFKQATLATMIKNVLPESNLFVVEITQACIMTRFGVKNLSQLVLDIPSAKRLRDLLATATLKNARKDYKEPIADEMDDLES